MSRNRTTKTSKKYKSDLTHIMIGGSIMRDDSTFVIDPETGGIVDDKRYAETGTPLVSRDRTPTVGTSDLASFMTHFAGQESWKRQSGMSLDGFFIPFAAAFMKKAEGQGTVSDHAQPLNPEGSLPSYERPTDLLEWWHVGSGTITSTTLNPYPAGHSVVAMVRNDSITDLKIDAEEGGYAKNAPELGKTGETVEGNELQMTDYARPVGLRGPMVMTGWGYDIEEFPVPNAQYEALERKDQDPKDPEFGKVENEADLFTWTKQNLRFLPQHLKRTDQWKAGPVDLRWDRDRKVWVGGRFNGVYLSKATKCILPNAGPDGKNSFNFGVQGTPSHPGRLYRNPCPERVCSYNQYFPRSKYYPDIEVYDPEDADWCGACVVKKNKWGPYISCSDYTGLCVPFYDALIIRSVDHIVAGKNQVSNCGNRFIKGQGDPTNKRIGNPCHQWGGIYEQNPQYIGEIMPHKGNEQSALFSERAKSILYKKVLIENPLSQGLMMGDSFFSYDTGRRVTIEYTRTDGPASCSVGGTALKVKEILPVHVILQAEFTSVEMLTYAGCEQGEMGVCSAKIFTQGFNTGADCGPDDDYPETATDV